MERLGDAHDLAAISNVGTVLVTTRDLALAFDYIDALELASEELARAVRERDELAARLKDQAAARFRPECDRTGHEFDPAGECAWCGVQAL